MDSKLPEGTPQFVIDAIETLEVNADSKLRKVDYPPEMARGYYAAVQDFKNELDTAARIEDGKRKESQKAAVAAFQKREASGQSVS